MIPENKESLAEKYMPKVDFVVAQERRKLGLSVPHVLEEMRSYGMEGLAMAIEKFDPSRKSSFGTYAEYRIRGAIYDGLSQTAWFPRELARKIKFYRQSRDIIRSYSREPAPADKVEVVHRLADRLKELAAAYITVYVADGGAETSFTPAEADLATARKELRHKIDSCIDELPPKQKQVITDYFFMEKDLPQIAKTMKISKSWASRLLSSALLKIRESFDRQDLNDVIDSFGK